MFAFVLLVFLAVTVGCNLFLMMPGCLPREEQCVVLKFLIASGQRPAQCHRSLQNVFGQETMSKAQVGVWHRQFRGGDLSVKDKPGCPPSVSTWDHKERPNPRRIRQ